MSYGATPRSGLTGSQMLNTLESKRRLPIFFTGMAKKRYSRRIAKAIVVARKSAPILTTTQFVSILKDAVPAPPTETAVYIRQLNRSRRLRMAVNDELGAIEQGVSAAWKKLAPGGRMATITFHSIEDRLVKRGVSNVCKARRHAGV